jgi:2'-5' RNA ligase
LAESAFAVNVPEAEPYVADLRRRFDRSAAVGVPAHVTILYPFMPPEQLDESVLARARAAIARVRAFRFRLTGVAHFPAATYLVPEPGSPFVALTRGLAAEFPRYPPYGGQYDGSVPHLTVAQGDYDRAFVERTVGEALPAQGVDAMCSDVVLIENSSGLWKPMHSFPLAPS